MSPPRPTPYALLVLLVESATSLTIFRSLSSRTTRWRVWSFTSTLPLARYRTAAMDASSSVLVALAAGSCLTAIFAVCALATMDRASMSAACRLPSSRTMARLRRMTPDITDLLEVRHALHHHRHRSHHQGIHHEDATAGVARPAPPDSRKITPIEMGSARRRTLAGTVS